MEVNANLHLSVKPCEPQQQRFVLLLLLSQSFTLYHLLDWDSSSKVFLQNHRLFFFSLPYITNVIESLKNTVIYSKTIDYRYDETMIFKFISKYGRIYVWEQRKADSWEWVVTFEHIWHDLPFPWKPRKWFGIWKHTLLTLCCIYEKCVCVCVCVCNITN